MFVLDKKKKAWYYTAMQMFVESLIKRTIFAASDQKARQENIDKILELAKETLDEHQQEKCKAAIIDACKDDKKLAKYIKEKLK
jgi:Zn-dependent M16 (insulinase) family peptidase